jgi:GT2 family glycosyltransferase
MKSIAVVLVDWNGVDVTKDCLISLKNVDTSFLDRCQIIVVDNGSDVPIKGLLEEDFSDIVYISSSINLGFAGGNNLGIKYAIENNFTYTLLLNNDTTVDPDFLQPLFETDHCCGMRVLSLIAFLEPLLQGVTMKLIRGNMMWLLQCHG